MLTMGLFFSLTTPAGVVIGIGISSVYNENSCSSLITQGMLDSVAAGILIYMALVDLLAVDFMNPKVQSNVKLQVMIKFCLATGRRIDVTCCQVGLETLPNFSSLVSAHVVT
ncbi:hypothetical protein ZIOFF_032341 [Zingiber officinale]|uniref:Uncharacterized protein n=1 Tax=Zingiber officinale TaxID=94328 RepID=A0A8J5LBI7_ZINOF|nr:hypothetical protein ZIOFF_032341 [Zingiber officinale]